MRQLNSNEKDRISKFIDENELDLDIVDNGLSKYGIISEDNMMFNLYEYNGYVISKFDISKQREGKDPYEYFTFKTLQQVLEQLKFYDNNLPKNYFSLTSNSVEVPFDKGSYSDEWINEFLGENYKVIEDNFGYKSILYVSENYKPEIISPFNTLHEVSTINIKKYEKLNKLEFIIHPISLVPKKEKYFFKLLCNNEEVFKEYINYNIYKKKGLKLMINNLFKDMERFKINP